MAHLARLQIFLRYPVVFPGNILEGYVDIQSGAPFEFVAVRIKIAGKEKSHCERERRDPQGKVIATDVYNEPAVYYKELLTLAGYLQKSGCRQTQVMPPGHFTYPFAFQLPLHLPPSFSITSDNGDTVANLYYVKGYVDTPQGKMSVHKCPFRVVKPIPQAQWLQRNPATIDKVFPVTCCCCIDKGTVTARIFMDRTVISIDRDFLVVCADIDNSKGKEPVESLEVTLVNIFSYKCQQLKETHRIEVGKQFLSESCVIAPGQKGRIQGVITLPRTATPTATTFLTKSQHEVQIEMNIPWASDPSHSFPVIVTQCVDASNYAPPVTFDSCIINPVDKVNYPEYFYQPPQQPAFNFAPMPLPPPSGAPFVNYNTQQLVPLPPPAWGSSGPAAPEPVAWSNTAQCGMVMPEPPAAPAPPSGLVPL